jgi:AbrB family looped-hinge helix DNA binding protein
MFTATVSPKYQIVIPSKIRESFKIKPGQKLQIIAYLNRLEIIPMKPIEEMMGFLEGMDTNIEREDEDRI